MNSKVVPFPISKADAEWAAARKRRVELKQTGKIAAERMRNMHKKIRPKDRPIIAQRLNDEIEKSGIGPGRLATAAGLANGPKELDKMRFREGNDPGKELLAYFHRYYIVLEALAKLTSQNCYLLVDRVTAGTEIHPLRAKNLNETEKTYHALHRLADEVDRQLGLFQQFRETLTLKLEGFARGELLDWPNYSLDEDEIPREPVLSDLGLSKRALKKWGLDQLTPEFTKLRDINSPNINEAIQSHLLHEYEKKSTRWKQRLIGKNAFWIEAEPEPYNWPDSDSLAYLPHAYLGILADWKDMGIAEDLAAIRAASQKLMAGYDTVPSVGLSKETGIPNLCYTDDAVFEYAHSWLILYPDPQMSTIIPAFFTLDPTVGCVITSVTKRRLVELEHISLIGNDAGSAYDGLVQLVGKPIADGNDYALSQTWIETGKYLQQNPLLRKVSKLAEARAHRDKLFADGEAK